jgi:excisionase family DNA binding protein
LQKKVWRRKCRQSSAALKFSPLSDDTYSDPYRSRPTMPLSISPPQPRDERQLVFTSSQAARYVGVSLATVRRWTDAGHIECYRTPGGQRRFSRTQLDEFIASMQRAGASEDTAAGQHHDAQVA